MRLNARACLKRILLLGDCHRDAEATGLSAQACLQSIVPLGD
ncbi:hypothetical protein [Corallococcus exercitus]